MRRIDDDKIEKYVNELGEEYKDLLFDGIFIFPIPFVVYQKRIKA